MKYIFDSSFLIALCIKEDPNYQKAVDTLKTIFSDATFYINELTYTELLTVATYKRWFDFIYTIKSFLEDSNTFFINSWNFEYIRFFEALEKKISVVDVSILYDSIKYNCEVLSFDKELLKLSQ